MCAPSWIIKAFKGGLSITVSLIPLVTVVTSVNSPLFSSFNMAVEKRRSSAWSPDKRRIKFKRAAGSPALLWDNSITLNLVYGPGPQNFEFLTTLRDKGCHTFLETLFRLL